MMFQPSDLLRQGMTAAEAAAEVRRLLRDPALLELFLSLAESEQGLQLLERWGQEWERYGQRAPWADLLD